MAVRSVPGIEARHTWSNGPLTLGDLGALSRRPDVWPHVKVVKVLGLHDLPDFEDRVDKPVGRTGEVPRRTDQRGKSITYDLRCRGRTLAELRAVEGQLALAFGQRDGAMTIDPHPAYGGDSYFYVGRVLGLTIPDEQVAAPTRISGGYERPATLTIRNHSGKFMRLPEAVEITGEIASSSGISAPLTAPFVIPAPGTSSGVAVVNNDGSAPADPVIDVFGPVSNPRVMNDTLGVEVRLDNQGGITLAAGAFIRIDFRTRQVLLGGVDDIRAKINRSISTWWHQDADGLRVGDNTIRYRGELLSDPARAEVRYHHTNWT
jgi:hypothetical protein